MAGVAAASVEESTSESDAELESPLGDLHHRVRDFSRRNQEIAAKTRLLALNATIEARPTTAACSSLTR